MAGGISIELRSGLVVSSCPPMVQMGKLRHQAAKGPRKLSAELKAGRGLALALNTRQKSP